MCADLQIAEAVGSARHMGHQLAGHLAEAMRQEPDTSHAAELDATAANHVVPLSGENTQVRCPCYLHARQTSCSCECAVGLCILFSWVE